MNLIFKNDPEKFLLTVRRTKSRSSKRCKTDTNPNWLFDWEIIRLVDSLTLIIELLTQNVQESFV